MKTETIKPKHCTTCGKEIQDGEKSFLKSRIHIWSISKPEQSHEMQYCSPECATQFLKEVE